MTVCPDNQTIVLQRYILAVVYFALGGDSWDRCNRDVNKPCDGGNNRYLSSAGECDWFGVECQDDSIVTSISLGTWIQSKAMGSCFTFL